MEFLLEAYSADEAAAQAGAARIRASASRAEARGYPVHVLRTIFLPEEETSLFLLEAASADDVRAAVVDAGLSVDRIVVAVLTQGEEACV